MYFKKHQRSKWAWIITSLCLILLLMTFNGQLLAAFGAINGVKTLNPEELNKLTEQADVLLVDVRAEEEYEVSHLDNAVWEATVDWEKLDKNRPIVLYCTIGFRSTEWGTTLAKQGFRNLYNLDGGIIRWKNERRIIFNQKNQPTDSVHVYSDLFGFLLREGQAVE